MTEMKKLISLLTALSVIISLSACGKAAEAPKSFDRNAVSYSYEETLIAENSNLKLEWDDGVKGIILTDKRTGLKYFSSPNNGELKLDEYGMPIKKHPALNSAVTVKYLDYETNIVTDALSYTGAVQNGRVRCAKGKDSLLVEFYFDEPGFMIPIQYILKESSVQIRINPKNISENENRVVSVSVAPFFCSVENDSRDTYLFVPSGSGALIRPVTSSAQGTQYSSQVYGYDRTIEAISKPTDTESVRLPVYGAKFSENQGICAIITDGAESASISVSAGASAYGYSAVYATFNIRGYTGHIASLFSGGAQVSSTVFSKNRISSPVAVDYFPLSGENAAYSGMANIYRDYLKKEMKLTKKSDDIYLSVNIVGGLDLTESFLGVPYSKLYAATTFKEAEEITKDLRNKIGQPINAVLKGFGESGVNIGKVGGGFKTGKVFGSRKQLISLQNSLEKNGSRMYMDFDLIRFKKSGGGFSTIFNACYNSGEKKAEQYLYNVAVRKQDADTLHYLLDPAKLDSAAEKLDSAAAEMKLNGISLESLTSVSYSNYSDKSVGDYCAKSNFDKAAVRVLKKAKSGGRRLAASGANAYAAVLADIITDAPTESDSERIFDTDIPFFQMVFGGYVPMYTGSLNLSEDCSKLLLKAVEGGCGISYTLIYKWDRRMIAAEYPLFYNSVYSDIKEDIVSQALSLSDYYEKIKGAEIISHTVLSDDLRKTDFSNGLSVYVNYGDKAKQTPGGTVEAKNYLITGEAK